MSYILVTPILNESEHLRQLKETILGQTVRPVLWVIGDGKSTDRSYETATGMFEAYDWVHVIKQVTYSDKGYSHQNFSNAVNDCLNYAMKVCAEKNIPYSYIGKTDATPVLSPDYYETLMREMDRNRKLAFTCGAQYMCRQRTGNNKDPCEFVKGYNDTRLYRREFLEEMGGYPVSYSPDAILMIKASNRGWEIKKVFETYSVESRKGGSKIGMWKGYQLKGKAMYHLGYSPVLLLLNVLYFSKFYPYYVGLPVLYGYLLALVDNEEKINDPEVRKYFGKDRLAQITRGVITEGNV